MKKLFVILLMVPFFSCSVETENAIDPNMPGEWVLVQTSGQVRNSVQTGSDMPFEETYTLFKNGTFIKTRIDDGEVLESTGTFELSEAISVMESSEIEVYVYFHHADQNNLIATCYASSLTEYLYLTSEGKLISTHNACDGLGLQYEKLD